jgi:hypothetical protein
MSPTRSSLPRPRTYVLQRPGLRWQSVVASAIWIVAALALGVGGGMTVVVAAAVAGVTQQFRFGDHPQLPGRLTLDWERAELRHAECFAGQPVERAWPIAVVTSVQVRRSAAAQCLDLQVPGARFVVRTTGREAAAILERFQAAIASPPPADDWV